MFSPITPRPEPEEPLLVSVPQAAHLLGIGPTLAWELVHAGAIPSVKLGRRVLVPRAALEHLAKTGTITPEQANNRPSAVRVQSVDRPTTEQRRRINGQG